jgi:hypothetical protein
VLQTVVAGDYDGKTGPFFVFEKLVTLVSSERKGASRDMRRAGGWDPAERLKDSALEGVDAAIVYTTGGFTPSACRGAALREACFGVYNDWPSGFCCYAPMRLGGTRAKLDLRDA